MLPPGRALPEKENAMGDVIVHRMPWEPVPVEETVGALQRDFAYAVQYTAVKTRSNQQSLNMIVNTPRGQIVPRGVCKFTDGTTVEFQDIGMPQPGCVAMSVPDLVAKIWEIATELGLELAP